MDYLKIGQANELAGRDKKIYRALEMMPGIFSWLTLLILLVLSYFKPVWVAYFIIAFDVYWLLLVMFLGIHLISAYVKTKRSLKADWVSKLAALGERQISIRDPQGKIIKTKSLTPDDIIHLVIFPISYEDMDVIRPSLDAIVQSGYSLKKIILVLSFEERAGKEAEERARLVEKEYNEKFRNLFITFHPDDPSELKGKGANQSWGAKEVKKKLIDPEGLDYDKILASVFDIDTRIFPQYFHNLSYVFLTCKDPYRSSYQPIPVYHNNVWRAPFYARVAASSNTFWQMMQQIRQERLATYSSHAMTWRALTEIDFWSKTMVSEDSRIFWHCFCFYKGDYTVEPLHYPVSMDVTEDDTFIKTAKNLYKQQRRWGWGVENIPYLVFNTIKDWKKLPKYRFIVRILVQVYGFHSWATNALIIGVIGWMPMLLGGDRFNITTLSTNLPFVTRTLMTLAMVGMILSAILSTLLLPKKPKKFGPLKYLSMLGQWIILPFSIIFFGAIPGLESQTRLLLGGKFRLGFQVTPKGELNGESDRKKWDQDDRK
jgi:cellulose synthase/poly-beta-1,6-N-acetylglucosamine synthase-like glycosyltransferase